MASISFRKFIRWLPDEASEPTSTLVLTSPEKRFVDLRVVLPEGGGSFNGQDTLPLDRLDWAMAGTSAAETFPDGHVHCRWAHWIDSRARDADGLADEGDLYPTGDGATTLEKGTMWNPATGRDTAYEELWFDPSVEGAECVVLRAEEGREKRGLLVRLGSWCQVLVRDGEGVLGERWELKEGGGWKRVLRIGEGAGELPCEKVLNGLGGGGGVKVGEEVEAGGWVWKVVEVAKL